MAMPVGHKVPQHADILRFTKKYARGTRRDLVPANHTVSQEHKCQRFT